MTKLYVFFNEGCLCTRASYHSLNIKSFPRRFEDEELKSSRYET